jgi:hypothetical protein
MTMCCGTVQRLQFPPSLWLPQSLWQEAAQHCSFNQSLSIDADVGSVVMDTWCHLCVVYYYYFYYFSLYYYFIILFRAQVSVVATITTLYSVLLYLLMGAVAQSYATALMAYLKNCHSYIKILF